MRVIRHFFALIGFICFFLIEFLKANLSVAFIVLFVKRPKIQSVFVECDVSDLFHAEILILAQLITLTPGTIVVKIDEIRKVLKVHVLDGSDSENALNAIDHKLKRRLLRVTR